MTDILITALLALLCLPLWALARVSAALAQDGADDAS